MAWLANTDVSPCASVEAVPQYIAKDCSKAETKSKSYNDLAREVLPYISSRQPLLCFVAKIINKMIAERDVSAQEVCHTLLMQGTKNLSGLRDSCKRRRVRSLPPWLASFAPFGRLRVSLALGLMTR